LSEDARIAVKSVLDETNSPHTKEPEWDSNDNIYHDVPLFSLAVVDGKIVLIVNDQSKKEDQITVF